MKKQHSAGIQLVVTVALKKEVPKDWLDHYHIPFFTFSSLRSGAGKHLGAGRYGLMVIATGAGPDVSKEAAMWIRDHVRPEYVVNIGTCGLTHKTGRLGEWLIPVSVFNEDNEVIPLETRLPFPHAEAVRRIPSLLSVRHAVPDRVPDQWQQFDALDMECYAQAKIFHDAGISFTCLKFSTDYSDRNVFSDFNKHLRVFVEKMKHIMSFLMFTEEEVRVTVIIPVYNREHTLRRALESVLSQSYQPEEIIAVDDGSSDRTREILKDYGKKITPLFLPDNRGPSHARNAGIVRARTDWIAFLDSDDCWKGDKLTQQVEYIRRFPFYEILQSEEMWIRNGVRVNPRRHHAKPLGWIWEPSLERCLVSPSAVLVKKSLLEMYGKFDENLPVCEDYDLWLRISRHHPVGLVPGLSVVKYGGHRDQLSRTYPAMDRYRVMSLTQQLRREPRYEYRCRIIQVLERKLKILIQGYEKRQKTEDAGEMRNILDSLSQYQKSADVV